METWEVVGVDKEAMIKFQDGKQVSGVRWYLTRDAENSAEERRYLGKIYREQFISNERLAALGVQPMPGQVITLYFNRFGDVAKVDVA